MNIIQELIVFMGLASIEAKQKHGKEIFDDILDVLPKGLEQTDDLQIEFFKSEIVPRLSKEEVVCLQEHFKWMINLNQPEGLCSERELQHCARIESIYRDFLEALVEEKE